MTRGFRSLGRLSPIGIGSWRLTDHPARQRIAVSHSDNEFEIRLPYRQAGHFVTCCQPTVVDSPAQSVPRDLDSRSLDPTNRSQPSEVELLLAGSGEPSRALESRIDLLTKTPVRLRGTAGLLPETRARALTLRADVDETSARDSGWLGIELEEGLVLGCVAGPFLLSLCRESNGWVGVFDDEAEGALLESDLNPLAAANQRRLKELLGS